MQKEQARKDKLREVYNKLLEKLGLTSVDQVLRSHVGTMTTAQIRAVGFCQCGVSRMKGKLDELRAALSKLLPTVAAHLPEEAFPEYPTQDDPDVYEEEAQADSDTTQSEHVAFEDLTMGEIVEVYWEGEHAWYEGEVKDINVELREFEIYYPGDGETLWHKPEWYPVRYCE